MQLPVFVYGTLKSDIPVSYEGLQLLGWDLFRRKKAQVQGNIHIIAHPNVTFPAVGKLDTNNLIKGELVYPDNPYIMVLLDRIEGQAYNRIKTTTTEGEECWIYQWHEPEELEHLIEHGDFQYVQIRDADKYLTGIPMQDITGKTVKVFVPSEFTIYEVPLEGEES